MVDLSEISGISLFVNEELKKLDLGHEVKFKEEILVKLSHLSPILLNKYLKYPESVYWHLKNLYLEDKNLKDSSITYDLFFMPAGLLGIECVKTHVFYSPSSCDKFACIVEVLMGELTITLQKNEENNSCNNFETPTLIKELYIIKVKKGERFAIPTGYFYTFSNTSFSLLVFAKVSGVELKEINYSLLQKEKGLALYLILKNAKVEAVANPKYKITEKIKLTSLERFLKNNNIYRQLPLLKERKPLYYLFRDLISKEVAKILV